MAVFVTPGRVRAARAHKDPRRATRERAPLLLKSGFTPARASPDAQGRLDYFGSNVNIAARLEPLSTDATSSSLPVRFDSQVAAFLEAADRNCPSSRSRPAERLRRRALQVVASDRREDAG